MKSLAETFHVDEHLIKLAREKEYLVLYRKSNEVVEACFAFFPVRVSDQGFFFSQCHFSLTKSKQ